MSEELYVYQPFQHFLSDEEGRGGEGVNWKFTRKITLYRSFPCFAMKLCGRQDDINVQDHRPPSAQKRKGSITDLRTYNFSITFPYHSFFFPITVAFRERISITANSPAYRTLHARSHPSPKLPTWERTRISEINEATSNNSELK